MKALELVCFSENANELFQGFTRTLTPSLRRILANMEVREASGCWEWLGSKVKGGYGLTSAAGTRETLVHRITYEHAHGEIPKGRQIHHRVGAPVGCIGPSCGNPWHTDTVTPIEHSLRTEDRPNIGSMYRSRTHCGKGHEFSASNTIIRKSGGRICRECQRLRSIEKRKRFRESVPALAPGEYWRSKTHCKHGHEFSGENLSIRVKDGKTSRVCLRCSRDRASATHKRKKL